MADFSLPWGGDLSADPTGDYAVVDGTDELQQRVIRRFLTTSAQTDIPGNVIGTPDYVWDPSYGGNARAMVDREVTDETAVAIRHRLLDQIGREAGAAQYPPATVNVTLIPGGINVGATVALKNGDIVMLPQLEVTK